jgi:osmoprotectant transport system ATP-binding protein
MLDDTAAISFEKVTKRFGDGPPALDSVSLSVPARQFLAIVGASGSGKTTLLQLINRLSEPSAGLLCVDAADVQSLDPIVLRRRIGYVFQEVGLFPHLTVAENIAITPRLLGWEAERVKQRVDELLELVRLNPKYGTRYAHALSGGEKQRVGVARALAARPDIVLMDEPFAAVDPIVRDGLGQDYRRLHDELGVTTVMITHDILEALGLADRIIVLRAGRVIADGPPSALLNHENAHVRELMQMPRKIAERVGALLAAKEP